MVFQGDLVVLRYYSIEFFWPVAQKEQYQLFIYNKTNTTNSELV